jgi:phage-related protein
MAYALEVWTKVYTIIQTNAMLIWEIIKIVFNIAVTIVSTTLNTINDIVKRIWGFIYGIIKDNMGLIELVATTAWNSIKNTIDLALGVIQGIITTALGIITGDWDKAKEGISLIVSSLTEYVQKQFDNLKNFVTTIGPEMLEAAKSIGSAIVEGIANGINAGVSWIVDAARGAAQSALNAAKGLLGIQSPSKVFEKEIGGNIIDGMVIGLRNVDPVQRAMSDLISSITPSNNSGATNNTTNWNVNINTTQPTSNVLSGLALRQQLIGG